MRYVNANDVLPVDLLFAIQTYYQGGYLYIPKHNERRVTKQTAYKNELEKRNRRIYLMHTKLRECYQRITYRKTLLKMIFQMNLCENSMLVSAQPRTLHLLQRPCARVKVVENSGKRDMITCTINEIRLLKFIEEGFRHLNAGGSTVMVTKRYDWYKNKLRSVFSGVKVIEEGGYYIVISQKRGVRKTKEGNKPKVSKKLRRKYG